MLMILIKKIDLNNFNIIPFEVVVDLGGRHGKLKII